MSDSTFYAETKRSRISFLTVSHGESCIGITPFIDGNSPCDFALTPDEARAMAADLIRRAGEIEKEQAKLEGSP